MSTSIRTLIVAALFAGPFATAASAESPKEKATRLMNETDRAKAVVLFAHFGADYSSHKLTGTGTVTDRNGKTKAGHFYLEYEYTWKVAGETGHTTLSFFFDANGVLTEIQVDKTDAILNQPFALANLSIKVVGAAAYEAAKDDLSEAQRKAFRKLVDDANAKGLLELLLAIDLVTSK